MEFYNIIEEMDTDEGWEKICSKFNIDTAKASVVYKNVLSKATASSVIYSYLRGYLRGFVNSEEEKKYNKYVQDVTSDDLKRVYNKYFKQFLDPNRRFTVMTTIIGDSTDMIQESFAIPDISNYKNLKQNTPSIYAIPFIKKSLDELKVKEDENQELNDIDNMSICTNN